MPYDSLFGVIFRAVVQFSGVSSKFHVMYKNRSLAMKVQDALCVCVCKCPQELCLLDKTRNLGRADIMPGPPNWRAKKWP